MENCVELMYFCATHETQNISDSLYFDQFRKVQDGVSMVVFITETYLCPSENLPHDRR